MYAHDASPPSSSSPFLISWIQQQFEDQLFCASASLCRNKHESAMDFLFYMLEKKNIPCSPADASTMMDWRSLSSNPSYSAFCLLEAFPEKIDGRELCKNPNALAVRRITQTINDVGAGSRRRGGATAIDYRSLVQNPNPQVVPLIVGNKENIYPTWLSKCPHSSVVEALREFPDKIVRADLCANPCESAVDLVLGLLPPADYHWTSLSRNPHDAVVDLLFRNQHQIDFAAFSLNTNPRALHFLAHNQTKINFQNLSRNCHPEAIEILRQNVDRIDVVALAENSAIFFD